jgi:hypothetical protein
VTHHPLADISTNVEINTSNTPVPPPRSPYRVNHYNQHQQHDKQTPVVDLPKRPPVLKLAVSNHSSLYSRTTAAGTVDRDYLISPGRVVGSNPSSPLSLTSAGSSSIDNRPSFEVCSDYSYKYSTPRRSSSSPTHRTIVAVTTINENQEYPRRNRRDSAHQYESNSNGHLDIVNNSNSKSEPSTPVPRTPRFDSLMPNHEPTVLSNLSNIQVKVVSSSVNTDEKGKEYPVFVIGIEQKDGLHNEIWRIEKSLADMNQLDAKVNYLSYFLFSFTNDIL